MRRTALVLLPLSLWAAPPARADFLRPSPGEVALRDRPGGAEELQEGRSIVDAPPQAVRRWLTEFECWPFRFHDVVSVRVLERRGPVTRFAMRSRIMDREVVLSARTDEQGVSYRAEDRHVHAESRIAITPTGDGRTDVLMQSSARVTGLLGLVAPAELVRSRARQKLAADLGDLHRLARQRRVAALAAPGPAVGSASLDEPPSGGPPAPR